MGYYQGSSRTIPSVRRRRSRGAGPELRVTSSCWPHCLLSAYAYQRQTSCDSMEMKTLVMEVAIRSLSIYALLELVSTSLGLRPYSTIHMVPRVGHEPNCHRQRDCIIDCLVGTALSVPSTKLDTMFGRLFGSSPKPQGKSRTPATNTSRTSTSTRSIRHADGFPPPTHSDPRSDALTPSTAGQHPTVPPLPHTVEGTNTYVHTPRESDTPEVLIMWVLRSPVPLTSHQTLPPL